MTPKEKAKELYQKYFSMITIERPIDKNAAIPYVKQCALIAVDEILKAVDNTDETYLMKHSVNYWTEVKKEIEAL
jgi:hypothetical protein